ncbi:hypothetical protein HR060_11600 [Catenovulum sp. SM1970]|uniref:hypothetical protein n=1 Tax=Marinifaba aquimaris TaxID=2741323 RepID=UPI0015749C59|nr:hypothetical protein [Marinifaba aquimaris]NTS77507.1 hypothetical protein [Marinifaba aquimaris]
MHILTFVILMVISFHSLACSCVYYKEEDFSSRADQIALVKILKTELLEAPNPVYSKVKVSFEIIEMFKHPNIPYEYAYTFSGTNGCSVHTFPGQEYIMYLSEDQWFGKCNGTEIAYSYRGEELLKKFRSNEAD